MAVGESDISVYYFTDYSVLKRLLPWVCLASTIVISSTPILHADVCAGTLHLEPVVLIVIPNLSQGVAGDGRDDGEFVTLVVKMVYSKMSAFSNQMESGTR